MRSHAHPWFATYRAPDVDAFERAPKTRDVFLLDAVARSGFLTVAVRYMASLDALRWMYFAEPAAREVLR